MLWFVQGIFFEWLFWMNDILLKEIMCIFHSGEILWMIARTLQLFYIVVFERRCWRYILKIPAWVRVSNVRLLGMVREKSRKSDLAYANSEIRRCRWHYMGHFLRRPEASTVRRTISPDRHGLLLADAWRRPGIPLGRERTCVVLSRVL